MAKRRAQKPANTNASGTDTVLESVRSLPSLPAAELFSFLKEMRAAQTWTEKDLSKTLNIPVAQAKDAIAVLQLQGYIDKAQTGTAGAVVGEMAYRNDYISTRASLKLANEAWERGKCVATPAPAPATPSAGKGKGRVGH